jgi:polysaccharide export outer membrane protein
MPSGAAEVRWENGLVAGTEVLVIQTDVAPSAVEARLVDNGLQVHLDGVTVNDAALPKGIKASRTGGTTRLDVDRAGLAVRSIRVEGNRARIVVSVPTSSASSAYQVGVGDVLAIAVYKNDDLTGEFTVAPDGSIVFPLVGSIPAAGHTEAGIAAALRQALSTDYLVDPQVAVSVKVYQSQFIYVTGAVARSGRVAIRPGLTLRGALAEAEAALIPGVTVELRRASGETTTLDMAALDVADTPLPRSGDVLTVLQSNYVSIYGEVRRSSRLVLSPGMTLLQAIAMAEGLTEWANKKKVQILRKGEAKTEELLINLNQVEAHAVPDPLLRPEDVIIVGRRIL